MEAETMTNRIISKLVILGLSGLLVSGCGSTWSNSEVKLKDGSANKQTASVPESKPERKKSAADVIVTTTNITNRKYRVIGDIDATVNKTTIFHADPTRQLVNEELKKEAAALGADAVILVRYGTVGVGLLSWGSLDGKGRAVAFTDK